MSQENFHKFYEEFLPKNESVRPKVESAHDETAFAKQAVEQGKEHGFHFTEDDVMSVMAKAEKHVQMNAEIAPNTVKIRSLTSLNNIKSRAMMPTRTVMCCW